ncbi:MULTISPECIES: protein-tyrosine phosphatase family protein [Aphanothece]|uniref:protein-tyrosine phosphatase family protein n=1 Tax=Aphanothece TaxID=1121 RepID=UPI003984D367
MVFRLSWVLKQELALGRAPQRPRHLDLLENAGLQGVLSLCAREEAPPPPQLEERFRCRRLVLPDSHSGRAPEPGELQAAVTALEALLREGPVYLHCQAGLERSPLVAMAWLMRHRRLDLQAALEYLREVHPASRPQAEQLAALRAWHAGALAA